MQLRLSPRGGFTLIELLMVILIMGILMGLVSGGILYAIQNARRNRNNTTLVALRTALQTYRHEYGDWPYEDGDVRTFGTGTDAFQGVVYEERNYRAFNRLLPDHPRNPKRITFLERGRYLAMDGDGERMRWSDCRSTSCPLIDPWGQPFRVTINLDADTVVVENRD